jgi:hypothetical protein
MVTRTWHDERAGDAFRRQALPSGSVLSTLSTVRPSRFTPYIAASAWRNRKLPADCSWLQYE